MRKRGKKESETEKKRMKERRRLAEAKKKSKDGNKYSFPETKTTLTATVIARTTGKGQGEKNNGKKQKGLSENRLIVGRCQSPLPQPTGCRRAITEPDYRHPPKDAASLTGNSAGIRNDRTGKTASIFDRGGYTENPGHVIFALGVCGDLGHLIISHRYW